MSSVYDLRSRVKVKDRQYLKNSNSTSVLPLFTINKQSVSKAAENLDISQKKGKFEISTLPAIVLLNERAQKVTKKDIFKEYSKVKSNYLNQKQSHKSMINLKELSYSNFLMNCTEIDMDRPEEIEDCQFLIDSVPAKPSQKNNIKRALDITQKGNLIKKYSQKKIDVKILHKKKSEDIEKYFNKEREYYNFHASFNSSVAKRSLFRKTGAHMSQSRDRIADDLKEKLLAEGSWSYFPKFN